MKIWLDDIRPPPDETWTWARSAQEFFDFWLGYESFITHISFDHDIVSYDFLGNEITGYHCLCAIEKKWRYESDFQVPVMTVHSSNPVGRAKMQKLIDSMK